MAEAKKKAKKPVKSKNIKYKITKPNGKVMYRMNLTESEIKRSTEFHKNEVVAEDE